MQVRRARSGPGLWPGPRRQARWAGRGLRRSRAGALDAGGADPDNARHFGPVVVTSPGYWCTWRDVDGLVVVSAGAAAGYGGDRRRPVTGDAVRGRRRAVGLASEGRGEKLPPPNGETPG